MKCAFSSCKGPVSLVTRNGYLRSTLKLKEQNSGSLNDRTPLFETNLHPFGEFKWQKDHIKL